MLKVASPEILESSVGVIDFATPTSSNASPKKRVIAVKEEKLDAGGVRFQGGGVDEGGIVAVDMAAGGKPLRL